MLSPNSYRIRRPSCTSDYILSGSFESQGLRVVSPTSRSPSPSGSVQSAPLSRRYPSKRSHLGTDRESFVSLALPGEYSSSGGRSPSTSGSTPSSSRPVSPLNQDHGRHQWLRKLTRMKDELDRLGIGFKQVGSNIRGSLENIIYKMSPTTSRRRKRRHVETVKASMNCGVKVEVIRDSPTRNRRRLKWATAAAAVAATAGNYQHQQRQMGNSSSKYFNTEEDDCEPISDHNFSMFLVLTNLEDGMFCAELPMDKIPQGLVRIRVRDYRLEVTVIRNKDKVKSETTELSSNETSGYFSPSNLISGGHKSSRIYCGSISIPIYVNPDSLDFELNENGTLLLVRGQLKGCIGHRRLSLSASDLRMPAPSTSLEPSHCNGYPSSLNGLNSDASMRSSSTANLHGYARSSLTGYEEEGAAERSKLIAEGPRMNRRGSSITRIGNSEFELEIEPYSNPIRVFPSPSPPHRRDTRCSREVDEVLRKELQALAIGDHKPENLITSQQNMNCRAQLQKVNKPRETSASKKPEPLKSPDTCRQTGGKTSTAGSTTVTSPKVVTIAYD